MRVATEQELDARVLRDPRLGVTCPHCGATRGIYCINRGGYTVPPHKVREFAALSATDTEKTGDGTE